MAEVVGPASDGDFGVFLADLQPWAQQDEAGDEVDSDLARGRRITLSRKEVDELERQVLDGLFGGLLECFYIPQRYKDCQLDACTMNVSRMSGAEIRGISRMQLPYIADPEPVQWATIELFRQFLDGNPILCGDGNPLSPLTGAFLFGPSGTGKTHLMAAFARDIRRILDANIKELRLQIRERIRTFWEENAPVVTDEGEQIRRRVDLNDLDAFARAGTQQDGTDAVSSAKENLLRELRKVVKGFEYTPADVLYIGFDRLANIWNREPEGKAARDAIASARYVFIDDVNPAADSERMALVHHVVEVRYEGGHFGTFITSNIDMDSLSRQSYASMSGATGEEAQDLRESLRALSTRLVSRAAASFYRLDFLGCMDWRQRVQARFTTVIDHMLAERLREHGVTEWPPVRKEEQTRIVLASPQAGEASGSAEKAVIVEPDSAEST